MKKTIIESAIIFFILLLIYFTGVHLRALSFRIRGHSYYNLFYIENAQHVRHAKMVADGVAIPRFERQLQHPDGYDTHQDTIIEEYIAGFTYRFLPFKHIPFDAFMHYFVPFLFCIGIFGIYGIAKEVSKSEVGGLYAAAFYACSMVSIERSMGDTFYREHLAIPLLIFALYFMVQAFECGRKRDYIFSGLLYFIALCSWRVLNFFTLALFTFFAFAYLLNYHRKEVIRMLAVLTSCIILGTLLFDVSIRYDRFLLSKQMFLSYAILALGVVNHWKKMSIFKNIGLFIVLISLSLLIPSGDKLYNHVWETFFYQLRYFGNKPADPSLLSFDARHYWVPPYASPCLLVFCNDMLLPFLLSGFGIYFCFIQLKNRKLSLSLSLLFYLLIGLFLYYLFAEKIQSFVIIFLSIFIAYGLTKLMQIANKKLAIFMATVMLFGLGFQLYSVLSWTNSFWLKFLLSAKVHNLEVTKGVPQRAMQDAFNWIKLNTLPGEAFVSDIATGPMIAYYADRPIVIHAYFESRIRERFREFSYALFAQNEGDLLNFFRKYKASYLFLAGYDLLNDDHDMSFRYITDNLKLNDRWVVYKLHFSPSVLKNFVLVYQNSFVRIFQCQTEDVKHRLNKLTAEILPPIFDERLFRLLSPDSTGRYWKNIVTSDHYADLGEYALSLGNIDQAEQYFLHSLEIIPTSKGYNGIGKVYFLRGDSKSAQRAFDNANKLWHR